MAYFRLTFFLMIAFIGCTDKILPVAAVSSALHEATAPHYENLGDWAAHPLKHDPSDSIPLPLQNEIRDTTADVFFIHPTTFTQKQDAKKWNADIDDSIINRKTDGSTILYQASIFNQHARVFAPRYRQAHISAFFEKSDETTEAFEMAYDDIRNAFIYYLQHENNGRPIIIAAHSQGSKHAIRLLKEFFENKPLQKQLVVAYVIGWPVETNVFTNIPVCTDSSQTGCICSWRTYRKNYEPEYVKKETTATFVTNPLNWTTAETHVSRHANKGSILQNFNKLYLNVSDARVHKNVLWIAKPKFPGGAFYFSKNYHIADYNLFYMNVRQNVTTRLHSFLQNSH